MDIEAANNDLSNESLDSDDVMKGIIHAMQQRGRAQNESDYELFLPSTEDAAIALQGNGASRSISQASLHIKSIAEWIVLHSDDVSGSASSWHNLVMYLTKTNDYRSALDVAQAARNRFGRDAVLLADAVLCAANLGDWELGDTLLEQADQGDYRSAEDWRLAVYVADYLRARARTESDSDREATYERALAFLREAKSRLPEDDRIYNTEAEVLIEANRIEEARSLLEDVIFLRDYKDSIPNPMRHPVAQCCLTYLQSILSNSCDYDKIIEVADAGIRFAATEQRTVNTGYFFYRKALAMDGQINANGVGSKAQGFGNQDYVRNAMKTYALAYALHGDKDYGKICRDRFLVLSAMGGIDDMAIDEYCSSDQAGDDD